ncbi:MAG: MSMEG_4193 family putative phosphomutase [Actinomycetota bacterium]|nr:MSMEG_4193 family putative phosphomutase [Actinomycetota bacterium]
MAKRAKRPSATTIVLVRHGQTPTTGAVLPGRAAGLHLADAGREQAERTAGFIGELPDVAAVYTSPLERARETAAPIGTATGVRPKVARGLNECDFGAWTGAELKALMKLPEWATVQRAPSSFRFPGGESFVEMQHRMLTTLADLRAKHEGGIIVCVSHADPIKAVIADAVGSHLDQFQRIVVSPCSMSVVSWMPSGGPVVLSVNTTGRPLSELKAS